MAPDLRGSWTPTPESYQLMQPAKLTFMGSDEKIVVWLLAIVAVLAFIAGRWSCNFI